MTEALNELERSVLRALAERNPSYRAVLEAQLAYAKILQRRNTGGGFWAEFEIPSERVLQFDGAPVIHGVACRIEGLKNPMVFILFTANGYLDFLEGAAVSESTTEVNFDDPKFELIAAEA